MSLIQEAQLTVLSDDELKNFVGYCGEAIRNLEEAKKGDEELQRLKQAAKDYENENFNCEIRTYKAKLLAARAQFRVRGLRFEIPEIKETS